MKSKNDLKRNLKLPKNSKELAEFFGILTGDGYINYYSNKHEYVIEISGHSEDDSEYFQYLSDLFLKLFNVKPCLYIRNNQNSAYLRLRSKGVFYFLKGLGFVIGRKEQIGIPSWIWENDRYMYNFLRGLIDTDGSFILKKRNKFAPPYPVIKICSKSYSLINTVSLWMKNKGFSLWSGKEIKKDNRNGVITKLYRLEISGNRNFKKWLKFIGFSNYKHIKKMGREGLSPFGFEPPIMEKPPLVGFFTTVSER